MPPLFPFLLKPNSTPTLLKESEGGSVHKESHSLLIWMNFRVSMKQDKGVTWPKTGKGNFYLSKVEMSISKSLALSKTYFDFHNECDPLFAQIPPVSS